MQERLTMSIEHIGDNDINCPLISIIVPVYNVEQYIDECVMSIINQTLSDIEIILVDDNSSDGSGKKCDRYAEIDSRVTVLHHKHNSGLTKVRKDGVSLAKGEYIGFVDSDDWIEPDMYEVLYKNLVSNNVDICTIHGDRIYSWGKGEELLGDTFEPGKYDINDVESGILDGLFLANKKNGGRRINGSVWSKLFKKSLLKIIFDRADESMSGRRDDTVISIGYIAHSKNIFITGLVKYHHREREGAYTHTRDRNGMEQIIKACKVFPKIIKDSVNYEIIKHEWERFIAVDMINAYNNFFEDRTIFLPEYVFKTSHIPYGSKILIYGAGNVGKSYYRQIVFGDMYQCVGLVDKKPRGKYIYHEVQDIKSLKKFNYDYILIAVFSESVANKIKDYLIGMGIDASCIIFEEPIRIVDRYSPDYNKIMEMEIS